MKRNPLLGLCSGFIVLAFAGILFLTPRIEAKSPLSFMFGKKKKKTEPSSGSADQKTAKAKENKPPKLESHRFFAFDDAPYYTSPDKRIGAKLLIDSINVGPTLVSTQHLTFLPGAHVPPHRHVYVTEVIYILKGNLTVRIDKETKVMGPDATAYIPPQTFHEYLNNGQDVCQFLQYYSPSGPEEEYRNWEIPGAEKNAVSVPQKATGTQIIQGPVQVVVPGTPQTILGRPQEMSGVSNASPAVAVPSGKTYQLDLKPAPVTPASPTKIIPKSGGGDSLKLHAR